MTAQSPVSSHARRTALSLCAAALGGAVWFASAASAQPAVLVPPPALDETSAPGIAFHGTPKIDNLKRLFPVNYQGTPVPVGTAPR